jgi:predicted RNA-binding protein with PUA-like domain
LGKAHTVAKIVAAAARILPICRQLRVKISQGIRKPSKARDYPSLISSLNARCGRFRTRGLNSRIHELGFKTRNSMAKHNYWLVKTEPECFSIRDLARLPKQTTFWDGVRNYQARNFMRAMKLGDGVLFYHSGANPPAVVGTAVVVCEAYPDFTAFDRTNEHFDPKATKDDPIWDMVDIRLESIFDRPIALDELRGIKELAKMELLRRGSRLSVQPVTEQEWQAVIRLAGETDQRKVSLSKVAPPTAARRAAKSQKKNRK